MVDGDAAVREWLGTTLERERFQVRDFSAGGAFVHAAHRRFADCVVLNLHLPDRPGLELIAAIKGAAPSTPVIATSDSATIPALVAAIKAGAYDFVERPFDRCELITAVREAVRNHPRPTSCRTALLRLADAAELTSREVEVLEQIAAGRSNKEAGLVLRMPPGSVEIHRARLMEKLRVRTSSDLMRVVLGAVAHGTTPSLG